jgi:hypothetical protein
MTIDEVIKIEGEPLFETFWDLLYDNSGGKDLTELNTAFTNFPSDQPTRIIYTFSHPNGSSSYVPESERVEIDRAELKLAYAHYQVYYEPILTSLERFTPPIETLERMIEDYQNLKNEFTEKYGEPDRTEDRALDPEALRSWDYTLSSSWTRGDTVLFLQISATTLLTISIYDVTRLEGNIDIMLSSALNPPVLNPALDFPRYTMTKYRLWENNQ